ncbi:hypothetical protein VNI00_010055 [Paramarasmius palmivorus]|uniref:Selenoprotein O n=1 Tax=Paramarasmius palmivorus TaxID=297713 RepID=A0AAW0CLK2_9AGAR
MSSTKYRLSSLPLPSSSQLLTQSLTPDPQTPSISSFVTDVLPNKPSIQRRPRLLSPEAHFSYVMPFPVAFPYNVEPPDEQEEGVDAAKVVEKWLADREALHPSKDNENVYYPDPEKRNQKRILIGLSETGLRDCLPHLDVGDAFTTLGVPSLTPTAPAEAPEEMKPNAARDDLIDILSGHAVLLSPSQNTGPWSLRYSGHQFGSWAGQLGDGRAISILSTVNPQNDTITELQLKGSGRTPFSRSADGLAVLRSSIREFLGAEAMQALGIPTTRSLALVSLPNLPVMRERVETACILTRLAPSFLRIGSFEALSPPGRKGGMMFFGGGQQEANWEALRILGEFVSQQVLKLSIEEGKPWGKELVLEVARRNVKMVAGWQVYGFMHGVINTDNVSIMGLTIDYGPYAFMDTFDSMHICNHSDDGGRYAYGAQPGMIIYALRALLNSLAPVIGYEQAHGTAPPQGWATAADESKEMDKKIDEWSEIGIREVKDEMERVAQEEMSKEYGRAMRRRLGIRSSEEDTERNNTIERDISRSLLSLMSSHRLDFHRTFRLLSYFQPVGATKEYKEKFISALLKNCSEPAFIDEFTAKREWNEWLDKYSSYSDSLVSTEERLKANPRFVLRQWVLEEVIRAAQEDKGAEKGKAVLGKVLHMACNPFETWGGEEAELRELGLISEDGEVEELNEEEKEERRFCGAFALSTVQVLSKRVLSPSLYALLEIPQAIAVRFTTSLTCVTQSNIARGLPAVCRAEAPVEEQREGVMDGCPGATLHNAHISAPASSTSESIRLRARRYRQIIAIAGRRPMIALDRLTERRTWHQLRVVAGRASPLGKPFSKTNVRPKLA